MAKIPYDMKGAETSRELPPPGVYHAKVVEMKDETPDGKARRLVVVTELTKEHKGFRLWSYFPLPFDKGSPSAWKQAQFLLAVTGKEKGSIDPDRPNDLEPFKVQLAHRPYNDEIRGDLKSFIPLAPDDEDEDDEDEDDEAAVEAEADEEEIEFSDLEEYTAAELLEFLEENDVEAPAGLPTKAAAKKTALLEFIKEELFSEDDEEGDDEDEDDEEDEDDGEEAPALETMSLAELKVYARENNVTLPASLKGSKGKAAAIAAIQEAAEDEGDEDEGDDYDAWDEAELKKELGGRELTVKGKFTNAKAIALLRADDAEGDPLA